MDMPTAVLVGATTGTALFGRRVGPAGAILFAAGGLVPDLDDLLLSGDGLEYVRYHRSATHSLVGAILLAPAMAGIAKLLGAKARFRTLAAVALAGLLFVGIGTDVLTWWGTMVFWPFSWARVGVGVVFIIDPFVFLLAISPFVAWLVQKLRRRTLPRRAFHVAAVLLLAYLGLCLGARAAASARLDRICRETGAEPAAVLPQPFSPLAWSLVSDEGTRYRVSFVNFRRGGEVWEERVFPKGRTGAAEVAAATEAGRIMRWFHLLPVFEQRELPGGRTEVVIRDVAYEARVEEWLHPVLESLFGLDARERRAPFRYRFVVEDDRVVEHGWLRE